MVFLLEVSPSSRAECRCGCRQMIQKGEYRVYANLGSGLFAHCYKVEHFVKLYHNEILILNNYIGGDNQ